MEATRTKGKRRNDKGDPRDGLSKKVTFEQIKAITQEGELCRGHSRQSLAS